jgi:outer membrane protein OmpA-like peptidoglycan-associated protein
MTSYIKSCQATQVGDQIDAEYADRILAASIIADAIDAYNSKRYAEAAELWKSALASPGGDQLRTYTGLYLSEWRQRHEEKAVDAFKALVDYSLKTSKVGAMFVFRPNSTVFVSPSGSAEAPYEMWLKVIAARAVLANACLEVEGHTSATGLAALNERLSLRRAEYVRDRLIGYAPSLAQRTIATGVGSRDLIVRSDWDGPHNAIDRRVEFKTVKCSE